MDINRNVKEYFDEYFVNNNEQWLCSAYEEGNFNYPVGKNRLRILKKILEKYTVKGKRVLDIGCGGGDISLYLASLGAIVTGIDMSETMLNKAEERKNNLPDQFRKNVCFIKEDVEHLSHEILECKYDIIIAFGLIGYLKNDEEFFSIISSLTNSNCLLIFSCRNELFNMTSISENTKKEIENKRAVQLIDEIDKYYCKELDEDKVSLFLNNIEIAIKEIRKGSLKLKNSIDSHITEGTGELQPRQSTPEEIRKLAEKNKYDLVSFYGVHPHLLLPRMNKKLPPQVFNKLSDCLCVFEEEPMALIWSSVFIGEFVKEE